MSNVFEDAKKQYIDPNGNTRILNYNDVSLIISPIHPLFLPLMKRDEIIIAEYSNCLKYIEKYGHVITGLIQDISEQNIIGIEINDPLSYFNKGQIPIKNIPKNELNDTYQILKNKPITKLFDILISNDNSILDDMRMSQIIAEYLKQYTLFEYSIDPDYFGKSSYIIIPDHKYNLNDIDHQIIRHNDIMYKDDKLIVWSEKIRDGLLYYVRISLLNNRDEVLNYKNHQSIVNYYNYVQDFIPRKNQIIFMNTSEILEWKNKTKDINCRYRIFNKLMPTRTEPYFYSNYHINKGNIYIIQNVKDGDFNNAYGVCLEWNKTNINLGYDYSSYEDVKNYKVYNFLGIIETQGTGEIEILDYGNKYYAALLFFKEV